MNEKELKEVLSRSTELDNAVQIDFNWFTKFGIDYYDDFGGSGYAWSLYRDNPAHRYHHEIKRKIRYEKENEK